MSILADTVTLDQILQIPANEPERIFTPANLLHEYRILLKRWYSDATRNDKSSEDAIIHVKSLYTNAREKLALGTWTSPGVLRLTDTKNITYTFSYHVRYAFELGEVFIGDTDVIFCIEPVYEDLYKAALVALSKLSYADETMRKSISLSLPLLKSSFQLRSSGSTPSSFVIVLSKTPDFLLLSDVLKYSSGRLESPHIAWIISGLQNLLCYLQWAGISHNALSLDTIFISPSGHAVSLLGGWWYSTALGVPLRALPERTVASLSSDLFHNKRGDTRIDQALVRVLGCELLDDARLTKPHPHLALFIQWLQGSSTGDSFVDYAQWEKIRTAAFGPRRFVFWPLTAKSLYPSLPISLTTIKKEKIMGYSRWSATDWDAYSASTATKTRHEIFRSSGVDESLDPAKFRSKRESRDSVANPQSNAIIIAADVTGSMGFISEELVRRGIGVTFEEILKRAADGTKTMITDPHLLVMGIGDVRSDFGPVQATQFESDIRIAQQLEQIWLEGHGGGNTTESYDAAWYFAAMRTVTDCWEKRAKKGYLFTVGDEEAPVGISRSAVKKFFGDDVQTDFTPRQLLAMAERTYHVFHIVVEEGNYARSYLNSVNRSWKEFLGQRVLSLSDHTKLVEVIISAIQVNEGMDVTSASSSWSGDTAFVVANALRGLTSSKTSGSGGLVRF